MNSWRNRVFANLALWNRSCSGSGDRSESLIKKRWSYFTDTWINVEAVVWFKKNCFSDISRPSGSEQLIWRAWDAKFRGWIFFKEHSGRNWADMSSSRQNKPSLFGIIGKYSHLIIQIISYLNLIFHQSCCYVCELTW